MRFLHKYMRAIGFSQYADRKKLKELLTDVIMNSDERAYTINQDDIMLGEFCKNFAPNMCCREKCNRICNCGPVK